MEPEEIRANAEQCLAAAVDFDREKVSEIVKPIFFEGNGPANAFTWTICMVHVVTSVLTRSGHPDAVAVPLVGKRESDGSVTLVAPEEAPVYVSSFVRLCAAYINDDHDTAHAIWGALLDRDDRGEALTGCMSYALKRAAAVVRDQKARLQ